MILAPTTLLRLGALALLAVVLQVSVVGQMHVLGGSADLIALLVAAVALYSGSVSGAGMGFAVGLLLDLATGQNLGASSLVLTAVGYAVGRYREIRDPAHGLTPIPVAAAATLGYAFGFGAVSFMLSVDAPVSLLVFREMIVAAILNALLALPAFWIIRRALGPALVSDPLDRRRRASREPPAIGLRGMGV